MKKAILFAVVGLVFLASTGFSQNLGTLYNPTQKTHTFDIDSTTADTSGVKDWSSFNTAYLGFYASFGGDTVRYNIKQLHSFDKVRWSLGMSTYCRIDTNFHTDTVSVTMPYHKFIVDGVTDKANNDSAQIKLFYNLK